MTSTCPPEDVLSALVDDALPPDARDTLLAHSAACPHCAAQLAEWDGGLDQSGQGLACARLGAMLVPLNWRLAVPEQVFCAAACSLQARRLP